MKIKDYILVFVLIGIGAILWICSISDCLSNVKDNANKVIAYCAYAALLVEIIVAFVAVIKYNEYIKEKKNSTLFDYNQRYAADKSVEKVVRWMLLTAKLDENGKIVGHDSTKEVKELPIPDVYDKEMFMRFFEELNIQINNHLLKEEDTLLLFAEYALVFEEFPSFRKDISDYDDEDIWFNYHNFIRRIKKRKRIYDDLHETRKKTISRILLKKK